MTTTGVKRPASMQAAQHDTYLEHWPDAPNTVARMILSCLLMGAAGLVILACAVGSRDSRDDIPDVNLLLAPGTTLLESQKVEGPNEETVVVLVSKGPGHSLVIPETHFDIVLRERSSDEWQRMVSFDSNANPQAIQTGDITGDGSDEVILSTIQGSGGFVDYWVYGFYKSELQLLLDGQTARGGFEVTVDGLLVSAGNLTTLYSWNGSGFIGTRVSSPQRPQSDGQVIHYRIEEGRVLGTPSQVTIRLGESLQLVRDDTSGQIERILSPDGVVLERSSPNVWSAIEVGESGITIIPNGYDWENSVEIKIHVSQ